MLLRRRVVEELLVLSPHPSTRGENRAEPRVTLPDPVDLDDPAQIVEIVALGLDIWVELGLQSPPFDLPESSTQVEPPSTRPDEVLPALSARAG